ncbi:hypothetical protein R1sor_014059 [Riccia sorocarpa]|uniref:Uncharacterized protein n=1 Tax=Riccia sorocarpa TaxID=122646 RepID=A0ABD3H8C1_9MARC
MGDNGGFGLDQLPNHLLQKILQLGDLGAADLASLEVSCYTFRAPLGLGPIRFKSMTENVAYQACQSDGLFRRLPQVKQSQLVNRCQGNWKWVLRFLKAFHQAASGVSTTDGNVQVVAGKYLTLFIDWNGILYGCGSNQFGILGQGPSVSECSSPVIIRLPTGLPVLQVSANHNHVALVTRNGEVYTYGDNSSNCCGHGDIEGPIYQPTIVEALRGIPCRQVSAGLSFTAAVTRDGVLYTWGSASHGQLGHGDTAEQSHPVRVDSLSEAGVVRHVVTGASYTLAVMEDGKLYSFGYGNNFCLGHGGFGNELLPREVTSFDEDNTFIISVSAGDEHCVALDSRGYVFTWGKGYCGPLGHGDETDQQTPKVVRRLMQARAIQISARKRNTFVLTDSNELFAFGWMGFGALGFGNKGTSDKVLEPELLRLRVAQVTAGYYHTVCTTHEGLLLGFGDNDKGQLAFDPKFLLMAPFLV